MYKKITETVQKSPLKKKKTPRVFILFVLSLQLLLTFAFIKLLTTFCGKFEEP